MLKRTIVRIVATLVALAGGVAVSAGAAFAVNVPDPIGPVAAAGSGPRPLGAVSAPSTSFVVFGMDWELALSVGLFAIAAALFLATVVQRQHLAHI